jgi:hypothetical protein
VTVACIVLGGVAARASFTKPIDTLNCKLDCTSTHAECSASCCGIIFCGKRCLNGCQISLEGCNEACDTSDGAFFETAVLAHGGRRLRLGGPFVCPEGAQAEIAVTLTQGGAVASGQTTLRCPAGETAFSVDAHAIGNATFQPASAVRACAVARTQTVGQGISAFQWCRDVTPLPDGVQLEE